MFYLLGCFINGMFYLLQGDGMFNGMFFFNGMFYLLQITSLEELIEDPVALAAGLALLVRVIKFVPIRNLVYKCSEFGSILEAILKKYQDGENHQLITHVSVRLAFFFSFFSIFISHFFLFFFYFFFFIFFFVLVPRTRQFKQD